MLEKRLYTEKEGLDPDMLTAQELASLGYSTARAKSRLVAASKCTDCGRSVFEPVTRYKWFGVEILSEGESIHMSCLKKRKDALRKIFALYQTEDLNKKTL